MVEFSGEDFEFVVDSGEIGVVDDFGFLENFDGDFLTGGHVDA
jgi:hypothetical protein